MDSSKHSIWIFITPIKNLTPIFQDDDPLTLSQDLVENDVCASVGQV